jgi:uncharacterized lipoprotein YajG
MASALRNSAIMKRRGVIKIILILAGALILTQCRPPIPVAAAVEFSPGVGADADQPVIKELVAAFNEAEAAVKKADLDEVLRHDLQLPRLEEFGCAPSMGGSLPTLPGHQLIPCLR